MRAWNEPHTKNNIEHRPLFSGYSVTIGGSVNFPNADKIVSHSCEFTPYQSIMRALAVWELGMSSRKTFFLFLLLCLFVGPWNCSGSSDDANKSGDSTSNDIANEATPTTDPGTSSDVDASTPEDTGQSVDGAFGFPCQTNSECLSGFCIPSQHGSVCTTFCLDDCPDNWTCRAVELPGQDITFLCLDPFANLCRPCEANADCRALGGTDNDRCIDFMDREGSFCGADCSTGVDCPEGYTCQAITQADSGQSFQLCQPDAGVCECNPAAIEDKAQTDCYDGLCTGIRFCNENGLTECSAQESTDEICDLLDNNCNSEVDEDLGTTTCGLGACEHSIDSCVDGIVQECDPLEGASEEVCDGLDNNCDGEADEGFDNTDGDEQADCVDTDDDNDSVDDETDNCPLIDNASQDNHDGDEQGDACDDDDDNDQDPDTTDCAPLDGTTHSGAEEVCDGADNNCDGNIDENACGPLGDECTTAADCISDFCVDGVCCDSLCDGNCLSCLAEFTGAASDGICQAIVAGQDPDDECDSTGVCNGEGECADFGTPVPVPAGTVVAWNGLVEAIPAGWHLCDGTNGTPDLSGRFIRGAGGDLPLGDSGPGGISGTTSTDGAHTGPATASGGSSPNSQPYGYGRNSDGDHAHAMGGPMDLPEHYTLAFIKASASADLPAGAVTWSTGIAGAPGYQTFIPAAGRFLMGVTDNTRQAAGSVVRNYDIQTVNAGTHAHTPGGHNGNGSTSASNHNPGDHTHDDISESGSITTLPPYLVLSPVHVESDAGAVTGVIIAYDGDLAAIPAGWTVYAPLSGILPLAAGGDFELNDTGGSLDGPSFSGQTEPITIPHSHNSAPGTSGQVSPTGALHGEFDWVHFHTWEATVSPMVPYYALHYLIYEAP
ncbi:MAG: hypothetical protein CMH54_02010 [Myxococcales bacterium]|nr:hypothetical protein [Myxococcales bacterium]